MFFKTKIQEDSDDTGGRVVFSDPLFSGMLVSVTYRRLPPGEEGGLTPADGDKAAVRSFLYDYALPELFEPVSHDTEVMREEYIEDGDAVEYFVIVRIPGGATVTDATGERFDSIRALLIFRHEDYMYMLGFDNMTVLSLMFSPRNSADKLDLVEYRAQSGQSEIAQSGDAEEDQPGLDFFAVMALVHLRDFKSTVIFK